jgi:hypothetical protein
VAPPIVGCSNGLEVQRDHVRCSDELRAVIWLHGTRSLTVVVTRLRHHHGKAREFHRKFEPLLRSVGVERRKPSLIQHGNGPTNHEFLCSGQLT